MGAALATLGVLLAPFVATLPPLVEVLGIFAGGALELERTVGILGPRPGTYGTVTPHMECAQE